MKDIDKSAYYDKVIQHKEKNNAGEYEIIQNAAGVQDAEREIAMRQVRESGNYGIWIRFLSFMILNRSFK
ncbi:MAG: hypothetical protein K2M60_08055 [Lachnospiraceae bacterium]|nr:hypothetical protein [Lachnospiraceae bacterium]MDE6252351.1 hypothetical protein [Lachnospiraceae bacterium]